MLIIKFLNYKHKETVVRAAKMKGQVPYMNQPVRFYQDMAAAVHKRQKDFDEVRWQLQSLGLRFVMTPLNIFNNHHDAEECISSGQIRKRIRLTS